MCAILSSREAGRNIYLEPFSNQWKVSVNFLLTHKVSYFLVLCVLFSPPSGKRGAIFILCVLFSPPSGKRTQYLSRSKTFPTTSVSPAFEDNQSRSNSFSLEQGKSSENHLKFTQKASENHLKFTPKKHLKINMSVYTYIDKGNTQKHNPLECWPICDDLYFHETSKLTVYCFYMKCWAGPKCQLEC